LALIDSFESLMDFISVVIVGAPDDFPKEEYLHDDEQLTLESAFAGLKHGMQFVEKRLNNRAALAELQMLLNASLVAYRAGDDIKGAHLLHDFEALIIENDP
jgi:hypothetical protein